MGSHAEIIPLGGSVELAAVLKLTSHVVDLVQTGETIRAKTDDYGQRLYYQESDFDVVERVGAVAKRKGVQPIQVALAWLLSKPAVTAPIVGVSKPGQLSALLGAFDVNLEEEDVRLLEECYKPHVPQEYR